MRSDAPGRGYFKQYYAQHLNIFYGKRIYPMTAETNPKKNNGALAGVRVLDLSRVLAAPSCTQILGDMGADVIKVERPGVGDEIRGWGPPFLRDANGNETGESGYYLSTGRNKRSVTIDMSKPEGTDLIRKLLAQSDVLVENFKVGNLAKFSLDYDSIRNEFPNIVYCSVTGYGQNGPYADRPGYDMAAQGLGGLLSITGEPDGPPAKVPIAVNDVITGLYAAISILTALRHRDLTGEGQHIDLALLDVQVAWLYNQAVNYFLDGQIPTRLGTGHPNIVPYQVFEASDGHIILGTANEEAFRRFCAFTGRADLLEDPRFKTNADRVRNRATVNAAVQLIVSEKAMDYWVEELSQLSIVCSRVNTIDQVFEDPQVQARNMVIETSHPLAGRQLCRLVANPIKFSTTPVEYRYAPPTLGQHTDEILSEVLGVNEETRHALKTKGII